MDFYLSGVLLAFVINVVRSIFIISNLFSTKTKNFNNIKMYYEITTGGYSKTKTSKIKYAMIFGELLVVSPLFSWLSIGVFAIALIKIYIKKGQIPEKIKEINFKLSSIELPKENVKECLNELALFYGLPATDFRTLSDDEDYDSNELILEVPRRDYDWPAELYLDKESKRYTITTRSPDYSSTHTTTYEYKFDNPKIYSRTIEHKFEYYLEAEYDIKDGVVLEKEVREKYSESNFRSSEVEVEERLRELYERVEWSEPAQRIKYFIMFRHGDMLNDFELKKYFRSEAERIQSGCSHLTREVEKIGGYVVPPDFDEFSSFARIRKKDDASPEDRDSLDKLTQDPSKFNISFYEFNDSEKILEELNLYISRLG